MFSFRYSLTYCPRPEARSPRRAEQASGGSLRESREAWFDRLTTPRKIEGKEVAEAQSTRDGECAIVISPKTDMVKETSRTTLFGVEPVRS